MVLVLITEATSAKEKRNQLACFQIVVVNHHVSTMLNNLDHLALIRHTDTQVMRHVWKQGWYKLIQNSSIWKIKIDSKYLIFYTQKNLQKVKDKIAGMQAYEPRKNLKAMLNLWLNAVELTVSQFVEDAGDRPGAPLTRHGHLKLVLLESKVLCKVTSSTSFDFIGSI